MAMQVILPVTRGLYDAATTILVTVINDEHLMHNYTPNYAGAEEPPSLMNILAMRRRRLYIRV